jgi:predicted alpha/beta hydrolase family esterase
MSLFHSGMNHWQRHWLSDRLHKKHQPPPTAEAVPIVTPVTPKRRRPAKPKSKTADGDSPQ